MTPAVFLFGPTGVGKTGFVNELPPGFEVVAVDSIQVYRRLDIGSAKPTPDERSRIPHHLIDIRNPDEAFDVGDFFAEASRAIAGIASRAHVPVLTGGTAYYFQSLLLGLPETPPSDPEARRIAKNKWDEEGEAPFRLALAGVDRESEARIQRGDAYRLQRAWEVWLQTGRPLSSFGRTGNPGIGEVFVAGLDRPREDLYRRIDARVDAMLEAGLEAEVRALVQDGYGPDAPGMKGIGYSEWFPSILGQVDIKEIRGRMAQNSRRYAKRQLTFFRSLPGVRWYHPETPETLLADLREWSLTNAPDWW